MKKTLFVLIPIVLIGFVNFNILDINDASKISVESTKIGEIDTTDVINKLIQKVNWIDSNMSITIEETHIIPPYYHNWDQVNISLFQQDLKAKKIVYSLLEDGGQSYGEGAFYFNNDGSLFCGKLSIDGVDYYEVYLPEHTVLKFSKNGYNIIVTKTLNKTMQAYRETIAINALNSYISFFPGIVYSTPEISLEGPPILITKTVTELKAIPKENGQVLKVLDSDTSLKYIGFSNSLDKINGLEWIWYKVETIDGLSGWVFGHPSIIGEI